MKGQAYVRQVSLQAGLPTPPVQIAIVVDTAYVAGAQKQRITRGVYVFDNQLESGSTGEGAIELHTRCPVGSLIGYEGYPIDTGSGDTVAITGFGISSDGVFGSSGYPIQQTADYWIGEAAHFGAEVYSIQLCITAGALRPTKYYVTIECQITVPNQSRV